MSVGHDAASESAVSASASSFSWSHPGTASAKGAIVFVVSIQGTSDVTSVTYGGAAMTLVGRGADTDTEPGTVDCYYLDGVATGTQTVVVNRVNDATQMMGMCATVTAASATETYGPGRVTQGGSAQNTGADTSGTGTGGYTEVGVDDGSPGTNSLRYAAGYYGGASPPSTGASSTLLNNHDFTSFGWSMVRQTTAGQGSLNVGFSAAADDRAAVYIAVRETPAAPPVKGGTLLALGVG
jgi:hypothetical protein